MPLMVIDNRNKWAQFVSIRNLTQFLTLAKLHFSCKQFTSCPVASLKILVTMPASSLQAALNSWDDLEDCIKRGYFFKQKESGQLRKFTNHAQFLAFPFQGRTKDFIVARVPTMLGRLIEVSGFSREISVSSYIAHTLLSETKNFANVNFCLNHLNIPDKPTIRSLSPSYSLIQCMEHEHDGLINCYRTPYSASHLSDFPDRFTDYILIRHRGKARCSCRRSTIERQAITQNKGNVRKPIEL